MRIPESLFIPSAKDSGSWIVEILQRTANTSAAAFTVNLGIFTVPADRLLLLLSAHAAADAGNLVNTTSLALTIQAPAAAAAITLAQLDRGDAAAANLGTFRRDLNWSGEVWVQPLGVVRAFGAFDSDGAANFVFGEIHGLLIPKGQVR